MYLEINYSSSVSDSVNFVNKTGCSGDDEFLYNMNTKAKIRDIVENGLSSDGKSSNLQLSECNIRYNINY